MQGEKKIYQVFVSSTYTDLETERLRVIRDMLMSDFYPLGMESFPASSEEQLAFCKRMIDRSDYYVLIIGTRYGSETADGLSYTELEYEYAKENGVPILVFVSEDPESKPSKFLETESKREKFEIFKKRAMSSSVVKFWRTAEDLSSSVIASLHSEVNVHPRFGLIRSDTTLDIPEMGKNLDVLGRENDKLRKDKQDLEATASKLANELSLLKDSSKIERIELEKNVAELEITVSKLTNELLCLKDGIASIQKKRQQLEIEVVLSGMYLKLTHSCLINQKFSYTISLRDLFEMWGPYLYANDSIYRAKNDLECVISTIYKLPSPQISMESFNRIKLSLLGCGVIVLGIEERGLRPVECITLTKEGSELLQQLSLENTV